jgi:hypothetical protein
MKHLHSHLFYYVINKKERNVDDNFPELQNGVGINVFVKDLGKYLQWVEKIRIILLERVCPLSANAAL